MVEAKKEYNEDVKMGEEDMKIEIGECREG